MTAFDSIFELESRIPEIDSFSVLGAVPVNRARGHIEFRSVYFSYPSRKNLLVYDDFNLTIKAGETVALCGASGCGKSTAANLLLRFYDPDKGSVLLDYMNVKDYNIRWIRSQVGYVGQEPFLFPGTIADNIASGLDAADGSDTRSAEKTRQNGLQERIEAAAILARAHDFISSFPNGYETDVGSSGLSLSGGQKQRIAIARALIRNPAILLFDEATSALDAASEHEVQESIDALQQSRSQTTIIIAHRLSTIRKADNIAVVSDGKVCEFGGHDELLALNGKYADLISAQLSHDDDITAPLKIKSDNESADTSANMKTINTTGSTKNYDAEESDGILEPKQSEKESPTDDAEDEDVQGVAGRLYGMAAVHMGWLLSGIFASAG